MSAYEEEQGNDVNFEFDDRSPVLDAAYGVVGGVFVVLIMLPALAICGALDERYPGISDSS